MRERPREIERERAAARHTEKEDRIVWQKKTCLFWIETRISNFCVLLNICVCLSNMMLQAQQREGTKFSTVMERLINGLEARLPRTSIGTEPPLLPTSTFISTMRRLEMGLSMVQVEELAKVCCTRKGGIDPCDIRDWLTDSFRREEASTKLKADPRGALCDQMFRAIAGAGLASLLGILDRYLGVILELGNPEQDAADPVLEASAGTVAPNTQTPDGANFDITWGRDDGGREILMPPGALRKRNDITLTSPVKPSPQKHNKVASPVGTPGPFPHPSYCC